MKNPLTHCLSLLGVVLLLGANPAFARPVAWQGHRTQSARAELDDVVVRLEARTGRDLGLANEVLDQLRARPEMADDIPGLLRGASVSLATSDTLIWGLAEVGSPRAQEALTTIHADGSLRHLDRLRAVIALAGVGSPDEAAVAGLWSRAAARSDPRSVDLSNTAFLALGAAGTRLGRSSDRYARLSGSLLAGLRASRRDPSMRVIHLRALANLHDSMLGPAVIDYLADPYAPVRASAAEALGMLQDVQHRDDLVNVLLYDSYGMVRAAAVEALRILPADEYSLVTVDMVALTEPNEEARAQMAEYLVEHLHEFEQARATLLEMTANDPATRIRILASYALRH